MSGRDRLRALLTLRQLAAEQVERNYRVNGFVHPDDSAALEVAGDLLHRHALVVAKAIRRQGIAREVAADHPGWNEAQVQYEARVQVAAMPRDELAAFAAELIGKGAS